jgi:hypothetical protein
LIPKTDHQPQLQCDQSGELAKHAVYHAVYSLISAVAPTNLVEALMKVRLMHTIKFRFDSFDYLL